MKVLVIYSSKHGATKEIAEAITLILHEHGHDAVIREVESVDDLSAYDAVVIGSAIYAGRWRKSIRDFILTHVRTLAGMPIWLFSSGPLDNVSSAQKSSSSIDTQLLLLATQAKEHHLFAGRLSKRRLGMGERLIAFIVRAKDGDYRNWEDIEEWGATISNELKHLEKRYAHT